MPATNNAQSKNAKTSTGITGYLEECIQTILKKQLLRLNIKKVSQIIANDLRISVRDKSPDLKCALCECLCHYMKIWPGWKDYYSICTTETAKIEYHNKLKDYLSAKLRYIMQNTEQFVHAQNKGAVLSESKVVQTEPDLLKKGNKQEAPFQIVISGQPHFLNNIGFVESNGDIVLTQHQGRCLSHLDIRQVLNYPYVKVNVNLDELSFSRINNHKFIRYISENRDSILCPETTFIDFIRKYDENVGTKVYTVDYISAYCKQFLEIAKSIYMNSVKARKLFTTFRCMNRLLNNAIIIRLHRFFDGENYSSVEYDVCSGEINRNKVIELEMVFKQFLRDLDESDVQRHLTSNGKVVNTIATNVSVCYNIGKKSYVRNKRMSFSNDAKRQTINFCEVLIPRMNYILKSFTAEEDMTTKDVSFKSLTNATNRLSMDITARRKFSDMINNSITYECMWCVLVVCSGENAYNEIVNHFKVVHKGEQAVVCFKCRGEFAIAHLAGSRWSHDCEKKQDKQVVNSSTTTQPIIDTTGSTDTDDTNGANLIDPSQISIPSGDKSVTRLLLEGNYESISSIYENVKQAPEKLTNQNLSEKATSNRSIENGTITVEID